MSVDAILLVFTLIRIPAQSVSRCGFNIGNRMNIKDLALTHYGNIVGEGIRYHASLSGNSFTNWSKVTPRHNAFIQKILSSQCHIICTVRTKTDYILTEKNGKQIPEKVGLKSVQRDGLDYEMTLVFDLDVKNNAVASKDRTGLFLGKLEQLLSAETGRAISDWCNSGDSVSADDICGRINTCMTIKDLVSLY